MNIREQDDLVAYVADLDEAITLKLVRERLAAGEEPFAIIDACQEGMRQVGVRYEQGRYFLSALIMAGEIFRGVIDLVQPAFKQRSTHEPLGRVLLGTVRGDIHDIGKNMFRMLMMCHNFMVLDLGVDVSATTFAAKLGEFQPDVIGLSGLLTISYDSMHETVGLLRRESQRLNRTVPIIIGGASLNDQVCRYIGADYWVTDAMEGVRLCQELAPICKLQT